jgi:FKBP-type peptidyl-prolyl cis-trans isomerase SlyD
MKAGRRKRVTLAAARAYGPYDKAARVTLPRDLAPPDVPVGGFLQAPDGWTMKALEVTDRALVLDLNHPLAGRGVVFEVTGLTVERPSKTPAAGTP